MSPPGTESSDGTADKPPVRLPRPKGLIFAFTGTLLFYAFVGPLAGVAALDLLGCVLDLCHIVWSNIAFYWLHTLQCPDGTGGECRFLTPTAALPSGSQILGLLWSAYMLGFIPATLAGLLVARGMRAREDFKFRHALLFGCIVGILFAALLGAFYLFVGGSAMLAFACASSIVSVYACVFATGVCWFPIRSWWPRKHLLNSGQARP
jgi:hypothetical protein